MDQQLDPVAIGAYDIIDKQIPINLCNYLIEHQYFDLHVCFASFVAQDVGDLSITEGDIIVAISSVNEHWMQGQVCFDSQSNRWHQLASGKQIGTFPINHCCRLDLTRVNQLCHDKREQSKIQSENNLKSPTLSSSSAFTSSHQYPHQPINNFIASSKKAFLSIAHSSSLSSGSSSIYSADCNLAGNIPQNGIKLDRDSKTPGHQSQTGGDHVDNVKWAQPPPKPVTEHRKSSSDRSVSRPASLLTLKQQDKLKSWLHTVKKKTSRLSTRITASLGLISLTRDEEFERHYDSFKQIEKSIRVFIKNLTSFIEHFESFLLALQNTSDNLADFYRDKSHQKEINELRKKNKALNCEHFHAFKRTVDRQVIAVASQLLQKFVGPHQLVQKRSAKLLDYDTKTKEMESCKDLDRKAALREGYVIAKDLYEGINGQLIEDLPLFNQFALDIFRECILVLLESRRNLMMAYTKQTANLLDTPLMASFTASDVASTILMSCELAPQIQPPPPPPPPQSASIINSKLPVVVRAGSHSSSEVDHEFKHSPTTTEKAQASNSSGSTGIGSFVQHNHPARPHSALSRLSSDFDQMVIAPREISSTPLSQISGSQKITMDNELDDYNQQTDNCIRFDEPDAVVEQIDDPTDGSTDNKHNEDIESTIAASKTTFVNLTSTPTHRTNPEKGRKKRAKHPIYIASWPFVATGPNQLSIACNQPLKLIKGADECGNSDWSLVKDKRGNFGYVPSSYIKKRE